MRQIAICVVLLAGLAAMGSGQAAAEPGGRTVIEVFPGPNALKDALVIANPGDVLNIHAGTYPEHVTVSVDDLTLQAAGDGTVTVDGTCTTSTTILINSDRVTVRELRVIGAGTGFAPIEINFSSVASGRVLGSTVEDTCGNAEYGVNVFNSGTVVVRNSYATGFSDAGFYIGLITSTPLGPLTIANNESVGNERGIIVENSSGGKIIVRGNNTHDNDSTGIWITNSDTVRVENNLVMDNNVSGIELDQFSDQNVVRGNMAQGHTFDLVNDGGTGNCFLNNTYTTSFGDISC
jgi:parallel beta-helix repeat protein